MKNNITIALKNIKLYTLLNTNTYINFHDIGRNINVICKQGNWYYKSAANHTYSLSSTHAVINTLNMFCSYNNVLYLALKYIDLKGKLTDKDGIVKEADTNLSLKRLIGLIVSEIKIVNSKTIHLQQIKNKLLSF